MLSGLSGSGYVPIPRKKMLNGSIFNLMTYCGPSYITYGSCEPMIKRGELTRIIHNKAFYYILMLLKWNNNDVFEIKNKEITYYSF